MKQHKAICQVLTADKNKHLVPTWQEMDLPESMSDALCPLLNFTDLQHRPILSDCVVIM